VRFKAYFEATGLHNAQEQIRFAVTYLESNPQKAWFRRKKPEPPIITWDDFTIYLKNLIADPTNALTHVSLRLKEARQKRGQSVRDLIEYIEQLERDILEQSKQQREAWHLLNNLHPEIRREVMRENKKITSRGQVITAV
jgi:hypothetical protein